MSEIVNLKSIEYAIWEWTYEMAGWHVVDCLCGFNQFDYQVLDGNMRAWLRDDGFTGRYLIQPLPGGVVFPGKVELRFSFENPDAALNFKVRWG